MPFGIGVILCMFFIDNRLVGKLFSLFCVCLYFFRMGGHRLGRLEEHCRMVMLEVVLLFVALVVQKDQQQKEALASLARC